MMDGRVRKLLADPERWTKRAYARDAAGTPVKPQDPAASCFCLLGALERAYPPPARNAATESLRAAVGDRSVSEGLTGIHSFNDRPDTTHADILAVLDKAGI